MSVFTRFFGAPQLSAPADRSFRYEQQAEMMLPIAFALLEGGVVGVIAAKIFVVHPLVLALITAAPMFGNLSSFFWNQLSVARPKVSFVLMLQGLTIACLVVMAAVPVNDQGALILVAAMIVSRFLMAGITTVRSVVWSLNYPRAVRAQITGRLQIIVSLVTVIVVSITGPLLDAQPESFRWVYIIGAAFGVVGILFFARVNVIGESRHRVLERRTQSSKVGSTKTGFLEILQQDQFFRRYQVSQFTAGFANMIIEAPLVYLVTRELHASYTWSLAITTVIPFSISILTLPIWARYLDRVHVADFRARQSVLWVLSQSITWLGALAGSIWLLALGRVVIGVARGGGSLAWQIGHNDFANQDQLSAYMGVHVTLTGVRGAIAPFLGIFLYLGWSQSWLPDFQGINATLFLVAAGLSACAWYGFSQLARDLQAERSASS